MVINVRLSCFVDSIDCGHPVKRISKHFIVALRTLVTDNRTETRVGYVDGLACRGNLYSSNSTIGVCTHSDRFSDGGAAENENLAYLLTSDVRECQPVTFLLAFHHP